MHFVCNLLTYCWITFEKTLSTDLEKRDLNYRRNSHTGLELISIYIMSCLQFYFRAVKSANITQTNGYLTAIKVCWLVNTKY